MMRRCYWFSTALVPVLLVWGGCGQEQDPGREGPGSEVVVAAPGEPAAPVIPEEQPVAGVEPARSAPASPAAGLRDASTALSDPLSRSAASERLSLRLRGVLGVRGLLEEGPSALAATLLPAVQGKAAPTGAGGGLGVRRQGLQGADGAAAAEPALPPGEGIGCWEELAADGTRVEGCFDELEGIFEVRYVLAEPAEGVVAIHQLGSLGYTDFVSGWTRYLETLTMADGSAMRIDYDCTFDAVASSCGLALEGGELGRVTVMVDAQFYYYEESWGDLSSYELGWGVTCLLDGSLEVWYAENDLGSEAELDYLSEMFYDAAGAGWGMFEVAGEDGEMVRFTVQVQPDGSGIYTDGEGNSVPFAGE